MLHRARLAAAAVATTVLALAAPAAATPQFDVIADRVVDGQEVACADVAWAAGQGLVEPDEVVRLEAMGVRCPDDSVNRERVPSTQYVVLTARAANGSLECADVERAAVHGSLSETAAGSLLAAVPGCTLSLLAGLVSGRVSGRSTCADIEAGRAGGLSAGQADRLAAEAGCLPPVDDPGALLAQLEAAAPRWGVELTGIALEDLRTGDRWDVNGDQQMSFMSSAKLPWAVMATAHAGVEAVERYAYPVFAVSDNDAAGRLIDLAGGIERLNRHWYPTLGMTGSCHQRWNAGATRVYSGDCGYPTHPAFDIAADHAFWNHNTANDMTTLLGRLWRGSVPGLDGAERARLLEWSTWPVAEWAFNGDGTLTGHLPPWTWPHVHHKVGWYFDPYVSASDIGIVDLPSATYALAVAAYGGTTSGGQADFLSWASCQVYRHLTGDEAWSCPVRAYADRPGQLELALTWSAEGTATPAPDAEVTTPEGEQDTSSIESGRTTAIAVPGTAVDLEVTIGPDGLDGDVVEIRSTIPDCARTLPVTDPNAPLSYRCRAEVPTGGPPTADRWTAVVTEAGAVVASASTGALFLPGGVEGEGLLLEPQSGAALPDPAEQLPPPRR